MEEESSFSPLNDSPFGYARGELVCYDQDKAAGFRVIWANPAFERIFGAGAGTLAGTSMETVLLPHEHEKWVEFSLQAVVNKKTARSEYYLQSIGKGLDISVVPEGGGGFSYWIAELSGPAGQPAPQRADEPSEPGAPVPESGDAFRQLTEYASDVIWVYNITRCRYTYVSASIAQLRGISAAEAVRESLRDSLAEESYEIFLRFLTQEADEFAVNPAEPKVYVREVRQPCWNGKAKWVEMSMKYRYTPGGDIEVVGVSRDVDGRKNRESQAYSMSYLDILTGLSNRRYYEEELAKLDNAYFLPLTIIMADVNGLKLTNDAFGHQQGDELLKVISEIIRRNCRMRDVVARVGGDEFAILLPKTHESEARLIIQRIESEARQIRGMKVAVSASFGYAAKNFPDEEFGDVYKRAEKMMYHKKLSESGSMLTQTIRLICDTLEQEQNEKEHCRRVSRLGVETARRMCMDEVRVTDVETLGRLHDIGKIALDKTLTDKIGELDETDWPEVRRHAEVGYQILKTCPEYADVGELLLCHHERYDGTGYPRGLKGEEIPLESRIISVVDAFDVMTHQRVYSRTLTVDQAVRELRENSGSQFDGAVVDVFIEQVLQYAKPQVTAD